MNPAVKSLIVVAGIVILGAGLFIASGMETTQDDAPPSQSSAASETSSPAPDASEFSGDALYKVDEVAQHSSEDDCWTTIDGVVYDITPYVPRHPGGDEILRACGTDGSSLFNQRQTENGDNVGSGMPHSSRAAGQLAELQIGLLDETEE